MSTTTREWLTALDPHDVLHAIGWGQIQRVQLKRDQIQATIDQLHCKISATRD
jgi:hypothetical protein